MSRKAMPHLTLDRDSTALKLDPWLTGRTEDPEELGSFITGWDYDHPSWFSRKVQVNGPLLMEELGLEAGTRLKLAVLLSTGSGPAGLRRSVAWSTRFEAGKNITRELVVKSESSDLATSIRLETVLALDETSEGVNPLGARNSCSRLLHEETKAVHLEGEGDRIPVIEAELPKFTNAPWQIWIRPGASLDELVLPNVMIRLNKNVPWIRSALQDPGSPIRSIVAAAFARTVADHCIEKEPEELRAAWESRYQEEDERTLGHLACQFLISAFPEIQIKEIIEVRTLNRGEFDAAFLHAFSSGARG